MAEKWPSPEDRVFLDFVCNSNQLQYTVYNFFRKWGAHFGGPGAKFVSMVVTKMAAGISMEMLKMNNKRVIVMARGLAPDGSETILVSVENA